MGTRFPLGTIGSHIFHKVVPKIIFRFPGNPGVCTILITANRDFMYISGKFNELKFKKKNLRIRI